MEIAVGRKWRIHTTATSYDVEHLEGRGKNQNWKTKYSCNTLQGAVQAFFDHKVRAIQGKEPKEIILAIIEAKEALIKAVPNLKVVIE